MEWILPIIFGGFGGAWWHSYADDDGWWRNPPGCIMCSIVIGAAAAVIIEMLARPAMTDAGFFGHVALNVASATVGNGLLGGAYGMLRGKTGPSA